MSAIPQESAASAMWPCMRHPLTGVNTTSIPLTGCPAASR